MLKQLLSCAVGAGMLAAALPAQDANFGISLPVTISGAAMYTDRTQFEDPGASRVMGGFRAVIYPTLQLGSHWFAYAALQARYTPYFYYDTYDSDHEWYLEPLQAYLGYAIRSEKSSFVIKAGRLATTFGSFPLRYDDVQNPLLDQPLSYIQTITLRHDQLACGVRDLLWQYYGSVGLSCGGAAGEGPGLTPVTLYGMPGIQAEFSGHGVDGRVQLTSGSPANPLSLSHTPDYLQWAAGGGYTIRQGFRVGVSGFRGPYLDPSVAPLLPAGTTVRDFPASGIGADVQWARGHWSTSGEWQRFWFAYPNLTVAPSLVSAYGEVKRVLTPRLYVSGRAGWLRPGGAADQTGVSTSQFAMSMASYEFGGGIWLNRHQLLKGSYEWLRIEHLSGTRANALGFQFVTTFHTLDRAFR